jgi:SOS-response transcriptional repressor LexA
MSVNGKLNNYFREHGITIAQVSRATGLSHSTISSIVNNPDGNPSVSSLHKIQEAYPGINIYDEVSLPYHQQRAIQKNSQTDTGWEGLPMFEVPVTLGAIEVIRDEPANNAAFYLHIPQFRDCTFGTRASGDSMYPEIRNGDFVICKEIESIIYGDIYLVITFDGHETVKYIHPHPDKEDHIILVPRNESIPRTPLPKSAIRKIYKVKGVIKGY